MGDRVWSWNGLVCRAWDEIGRVWELKVAEAFVVGKGGDGPFVPFAELKCRSFCVRKEPMYPDYPSKLFVGEDLTTVKLLPLL